MVELREAAWLRVRRWSIVLALVVLAVAIVGIMQRRYGAFTSVQCSALYKTARTAADTVQVDQARPNMGGRDEASPVSCGQLRAHHGAESDPDILVTESDSFVHLQKWTERDSLVGAFIKLGHARKGRDASDEALPGSVELGRTPTAVIRSELGAPAHFRSAADTTWLEYASPFIGPDEAVTFVIVRDTVRRVRWQLYSE